MAAVPLTLYLARREQEGTPSSGAPNQLDIQASTEAWYQKGIAEGMERARAACDAAIARKEEDCRARLDQARKNWSETEGAVLGQQTRNAITALHNEIGETVARILRPLAEKAIVEEALSKLAVEIGKLLSDDDAIRLRISGPSDLISQLRHLMPQNVPLTVVEGESPEVAVFANKTVIETRLHEWLECIGVDSHASKEEG